jgi:hypothetical protein
MNTIHNNHYAFIIADSCPPDGVTILVLNTAACTVYATVPYSDRRLVSARPFHPIEGHAPSS